MPLVYQSSPAHSAVSPSCIDIVPLSLTTLFQLGDGMISTDPDKGESIFTKIEIFVPFWGKLLDDLLYKIYNIENSKW